MITVTMTEQQARIVVHALDIYFRVQMGQVQEIKTFPQFMLTGSIELVHNLDNALTNIKPIMFPALSRNEYLSITSPELHDSARNAVNVHDALRHHLYHMTKNPTSVNVAYYPPRSYHDDGLPTVTSDDKT